MFVTHCQHWCLNMFVMYSNFWCYCWILNLKIKEIIQGVSAHRFCKARAGGWEVYDMAAGVVGRCFRRSKHSLLSE